MTNYYNPVNDGQAWPVSKALSETNLSKVESGNTLMDNVLSATHEGAFGGCILKNSNGRFGFKITPGTGLNVSVSPGRGIAGDKLHQLMTDITVPTTPRKAGLLYAQKQPLVGNLVPAFGIKNAIFHVGNGHSINRYYFSEEGNPQDAVGNNHITAMVDCERVDGHVDYARKGNGTTSYMATAGVAGINLNNPRTELILYTPHNLTAGIRYIKVYGNYRIYTEGARLKVEEQAAVYDTGYDCQLNKTTYIAVRYDGTTLTVFAGSNVFAEVYRTTAAFSTTTGTLIFVKNSTAANYNAATMQFYELLDYAMSDEEIYQSANDFIIPCRYQGAGDNVIPVMTSNTAPAGIASASANDGDAYKAFDGDNGTVWAMAGATGQLNYEHFVPKKIVAYGVKCITGNTNPANWTFQALDADGMTWITLDTQTGVRWHVDRESIFYIPNTAQFYPDYYKSYRLNITANFGGATTEIVQFNMYDNLIERSIVDDILSADAISLGFVLSGSTEVEEIDNQSYKYGRIEYGDNGGKGNKRVFSGWLYVAANGIYNMPNVLGTDNILPPALMYKKNLTNNMYTPMEAYARASETECFAHITLISRTSIQIKIGVAGVIRAPFYYLATIETSGYIGFWMEVAE